MNEHDPQHDFERRLEAALRSAADGAPTVTERNVVARLRRRTVTRAVTGGASAVALVALLVALLQPWQPIGTTDATDSPGTPDTSRTAIEHRNDRTPATDTPSRADNTNNRADNAIASAPPARRADDHAHLIAYLSERGVLGRPLLTSAVFAGDPHPAAHAFDARLDLRHVDLDALLQSLGPDAQFRFTGIDVSGG